MNTPNKQAELEERYWYLQDHKGDSNEAYERWKTEGSNLWFKLEGIKEGKAQAISEFKKKLKEELYRKLEIKKRIVIPKDIDRIIDKTAQEITG